MGLNFIGSSSNYDDYDSPPIGGFKTDKPGVYYPEYNYFKPPRLPNPDPTNFEIKEDIKVGDYLIILVNYPDCNNYEGNKVLVYKGVQLSELIEQGSVDPHFSNNKKKHSPIARFKPNTEGWRNAHKFVHALY